MGQVNGDAKFPLLCQLSYVSGMWKVVCEIWNRVAVKECKWAWELNPPSIRITHLPRTAIVGEGRIRTGDSSYEALFH
jgi:hypothetical protein